MIVQPTTESILESKTQNVAIELDPGSSAVSVPHKKLLSDRVRAKPL